jgi:glucose-1-phosphate thymidylyltransferase
LGDGSQWGIKLVFETQAKPEGLAQAILIAEEFLGQDPFALILGDNIFYGDGMGTALSRMTGRSGATVFAFEVPNPQEYGVIEFGPDGRALAIVEKPESPKSNFAVPGLYFYDQQAIGFAKSLKPSNRGELEITDLHRLYLEQGLLNVEVLDKSKTWLDTGTLESLFLAADGVRSIEQSIGKKINVPEEVAWRLGLIDDDSLRNEATKYGRSGYGDYLRALVI